MNAAESHLRMEGFGWLTAVAAIVSIAAIGGCSRPSGTPRYHVAGTVTYDGKPLVVGRIAFEPDTDRGNKGPGGYGDIVNGRYETYRTMGAVGGPHRVVIEGYSGTTPDQLRKREHLFPTYVTTVDLPLESTSVDFNVPVGRSAMAR